MCEIHVGNYEKALEIFQEVGQQNSMMKVCHLNQVLALYLKKEYTKSEQKFEEVEHSSVFETIYRREIESIEQDLAKEENDEIKEKIQFKLKGFNQILVMLEEKRTKKQELSINNDLKQVI